MKKILIILLMGLMVSLFLLGCGKKEEPKTEPATEKAVETMAEDTTMMLDTTAVMDTTMMEETKSEPSGH
ncbi:MAG: hypothetical protein CVT49_02345 [candidate division Zixibacteria bacterium HGW-Zixibacteria-1]|nr:MAG: hypothetical protein CVT49_02345 [candidate division Zixibacteria bacterium HGW-Zixibacteria-1]